jgi:hypothetical protein
MFKFTNKAGSIEAVREKEKEETWRGTINKADGSAYDDRGRRGSWLKTTTFRRKTKDR